MNTIKAHPFYLAETIRRNPDLTTYRGGRCYVGLVEGGQLSDAKLEAGNLFFVLVEVMEKNEARITKGFSDGVDSVVEPRNDIDSIVALRGGEITTPQDETVEDLDIYGQGSY